MHNRQLHGALAAFVEEAAWQLAAETADGAEIPFEVVRGGRRDSPLYCYRPLTADFIEQRVGLLSRLPSFLPAVHALSGLGRLGDYLESRGERGYPAEPMTPERPDVIWCSRIAIAARAVASSYVPPKPVACDRHNRSACEVPSVGVMSVGTVRSAPTPVVRP